MELEAGVMRNILAVCPSGLAVSNVLVWQCRGSKNSREPHMQYGGSSRQRGSLIVNVDEMSAPIMGKAGSGSFSIGHWAALGIFACNRSAITASTFTVSGYLDLNISPGGVNEVAVKVKKSHNDSARVSD